MCQTDGRGGGEYFRARSVSWQCHANGDKAREAKTKTAKKEGESDSAYFVETC